VSVNGLPGILWLTKQKRVDRDYAVFGEASFDITPELTLTAGGRAFIYDNSLIGFFGFGRNPAGPPFNAAGSSRTGVAGCYTTTGEIRRNNATAPLLPAAVEGGPCTNLGDYNTRTGTVYPKQADGQGFTHKLNLTWKPTRDILFYGTWSRGFRPGGINRRASVGGYAADYLTNYEFGWKTTFLDGKLRFNGAVYQQDWNAFQFAFLGQNSFTQIQNGPNARIKGVEADVTLTPVEGLSLSASGAYNDAKTRQNLCESAVDAPPCAGNVLAPAGTRLPITPQFKANGIARYTFGIGDTAKAHVQGVVVHASSASSDIRVADALRIGRLEAYTTADFALGIDWARFSAELFVQNAFDERAQISRGTACGPCTRVYINIVTPRTIGFRLGAKF